MLRTRTRPRVWVVALGFTILGVVAYWPLVRHVRTRFWANQGDGAPFIWNYWAFPRDVFAGHNPFTTKEILYPVGFHAAANTNTPLWSIAAWPVQHAVGLPTTSVLIGLAAVVLSGLGAYLLACKLGCSPLVAAFAGIAFELLPWRTNRIVEHLNLIHTEFIAFGLLALLTLYDDPRRRRAVVLGLIVAGAALTDYTIALFLVGALAVVALGRRATFRRPVLPLLGLAAAVALVVMLPLLAPLARDIHSGEMTNPPGLGGADVTSTDLVSWVVPSAQHPLWGSSFTRFVDTTGRERFAYIGMTVGALAVVGCVLAWRRARVWAVMALVFILLSFGPGLHVNGWTGSAFRYEGFRFSIPMPYLVLHRLPLFPAFRAPGRFAAVASLALVMLAAIGLDRLVRRWPNGALAVALPVIAIALVTLEYLPQTSYPQLGSRLEPVYARMARDPSPGAVLDIPLQWRTGYTAVGDSSPFVDDSRFMYEATAHHRAMAGGSVSRLPDGRMKALMNIPVYNQVLRLQGDLGPSVPKRATFSAADLDRLGIRFVVYHRERRKRTAQHYFESLHLPVYYSSPTIIVWKVPHP